MSRAIFGLNLYDSQSSDYTTTFEEDRSVQQAIAAVCVLLVHDPRMCARGRALMMTEWRQ